MDRFQPIGDLMIILPAIAAKFDPAGEQERKSVASFPNVPPFSAGQ
jgi:hypothetical protein